MAPSTRGGSRSRDMSNGSRGVQPEEETYDKSMAPRFVSVASDAYVREGQLVRLDCRVSGRPYPDVRWYKNGGEVSDDWTHKVDHTQSSCQQESLNCEAFDLNDVHFRSCW